MVNTMSHIVAPNKSFQQDKKQLVFAPSSLILTNYFIASE
ncbi:hypothetical protein PPHE_b0628 [Pseudoalteromonas phenolica O-BC30]|nr:hypothetical protein [Pseudoalteromonas phenolica O-BC30]